MPAETCPSPVSFQTFGVKKIKTESCICHTKFGIVTFILIMFILHKTFFHEKITENVEETVNAFIVHDTVADNSPGMLKAGLYWHVN